MVKNPIEVLLAILCAIFLLLYLNAERTYKTDVTHLEAKIKEAEIIIHQKDSMYNEVLLKIQTFKQQLDSLEKINKENKIKYEKQNKHISNASIEQLDSLIRSITTN